MREHMPEQKKMTMTHRMLASTESRDGWRFFKVGPFSVMIGLSGASACRGNRADSIS
jgi:hypothetical protein